MKKILTSLAATFGFMGLTALVLFLFEATGTGTLNLPTGSLTANIVSNSPIDAPPAANGISQNQAAPPVQAPAEASVPATAPTPREAPIEVVTPAATPAPDPAPAAPPPKTLAPLADAGSAVTSTDATTSITVTTTAPPIPPTPPQIPAPVPDPAALVLPYAIADFHGDTNWKTSWGATNVTWSGALDLTAGPGSTGGAVYLQNANHWTNYELDGTIDWTAGKTFGLMANYRDASNYVLCKFERADQTTVTMRLEEYRNGVEIFLTPIADVAWNGGPETDVLASMKVGGLYGTCSFAGASISNATIGPGNSAMTSAGNGSIGFLATDPAPQVSQIIIKEIKVSGA